MPTNETVVILKLCDTCHGNLPLAPHIKEVVKAKTERCPHDNGVIRHYVIPMTWKSETWWA